jgi:ATP-dependent RNA helicase SUPV3L1/SUV3
VQTAAERSEGGFKGKGKKGGKPLQNSPQKFESRPARPEKKIDPDNPFAALAALKGKI